MDYKVDLEDVSFTLFDFLRIDQLSDLPRFQGQSADLYKSVIDQAVKFIQKEVAPLNEKADRIGARLIDGQVQLPEGFRKTFKSYADNGFLAVDIGEHQGGMGLPSTINTAVFEFLMGACPSFGFFQVLARGDSLLLEAFGTEDQKKIYLSKLISGEWTGTMCLTEPHAGSAVGDLSTVARKNADGSYSLQGTKIFITCGDHDVADNILHFVLARIEGDAPGTKGISLFLVPKRRVKPDGSLGEDNDVTLVSIEHKMGIKASPTCVLQFGDHGECQGFLVGAPSQGMACMFVLMNEARIGVGSQGVGIAGTAYEHALSYAKERTQGGKTKIIDYPDVRRMLITMKAYVEALRLLLSEATLFLDFSLHHPEEKTRREYDTYLGIMTPVCKAFGADMGFRVTELAIQTYGGYGYVSDYPAEQYLRDLKIASIYEGTNGIQAMDLIGRKFLKDAGQGLKRYFGWIFGRLLEAGEEKEIKPLAHKVEEMMKRWMSAAETVGKRAAAGDFSDAGLAATPFLRALGDILCAQLLVRRATVAVQALRSSPSAERSKFLKSKIEVAAFYVEQLLPEADLNIARIVTEDRSALMDIF